MGAENLNPLDELKNLDRQVELVTDLAALKPIFYRLDEIAKQHPDDFEVQLVVGDIKQHLVNRGTRLKEQQQAVKAPAAPPPVPQAAPPPIPAATPQAAPPRVPAPPAPPPVPPPVRTPPPVPPVNLTPPPPPLPPPVPPTSATPPPMPASPNVSAPSGIVPPSPSSPTPTLRVPPPPAEPFATGQQPPVFKPETALPQKTPPVTPPAPPRKPPRGPHQAGRNWKRPMLIGAVLGAIAAIAIIAFLVNQARKRYPKEPVVATVQVDVTTTPANASIRINGETKCNSPCQVPLAPGTYQVMAFLDGYDPATNAVNVAAGQPSAVTLALTAQAQSVRILTDLDQGKVALDDQPPADLQEGQFILDKVAPGTHTIKLTGKSGDASFTFEIADAKPPALTGPIATRNLIAVVVSSFGTQAHMVTSAGPMKLAVNGQPEADAGPAGVDLKAFQPGVDEIVVGDGKDQRNMKESFGPAPMLTAFLKSDLNIGTLIVSTGEDDVRVFINNKEYRRRTQRGQLRIPAIGPVSVRVTKDGFQNEPAQTADVKKGAEVRLEFKLRSMPLVSTLQIRGATPGTEVLLDQSSVGTVGADGSLTYANVPPGDHTIDLKRDQFTPKRMQRNFKAGQALVLSGADVVLASAPTGGTIRLTKTPADATVTYRRADETQAHELRANQLELPAGSYIFSGHAQGYVDKTERVQIAVGETRTVELALTRAAVAAAPAPKNGDMADFEDPTAWRKEGELWLHKGGGFVPYNMGPRGVYTFTVELVHGGNLFKGGRIRWCVQYVDAKNYLLYEMDRKNFWAEVIEKGKKLERQKIQHDLEKQKAFTIQIEITPEHCIHRIKNAEGAWIVLDSFAEPGRNFTSGKFGFLIQGSDEIGVSDFSFSPK